MKISLQPDGMESCKYFEQILNRLCNFSIVSHKIYESIKYFYRIVVSSTLPAAQQPQTPNKKTDQTPQSNILLSFNNNLNANNDNDNKFKQKEVIMVYRYIFWWLTNNLCQNSISRIPRYNVYKFIFSFLKYLDSKICKRSNGIQR